MYAGRCVYIARAGIQMKKLTMLNRSDSLFLSSPFPYPKGVPAYE